MAEGGRPVFGWDVGGAHLKLVRLDGEGRPAGVEQLACPLWLGLDRLEAALDAALADAPGPARSAVTMTAELADCFPDRATGVARVLGVLEARLGAGLAVYAGPDGFLDPAAARRRWDRVASANWHATAAALAARLEAGLLLDIGSTTTDIVPFRDGRPDALGYGDAERLAEDELVYTGVVRTPVMALAGRVPFAGRWQPVMAELFATLADVHRLTGALPEGADLQPAADGGDKSVEASARRLLRMVGADLAPDGMPAARRLARHLADIQTVTIERALDRVLSRGAVADAAPIVGAGVGRFLARRIAERAGRPYQDIGAALAGDGPWRDRVADCAPAAAVALLRRAAGA